METNARYVIVGLFAAIVAAAGFHLRLLAAHDRRLDCEASDLPRSIRRAGGWLASGCAGAVQRLARRRGPDRESTLTIQNWCGPRSRSTRRRRFAKILTSASTASVSWVRSTYRSPAARPRPRWIRRGGGPPLLVADPNASESLGQAAQQAVNQLNAVLNDNASPLHNAIVSFSSFSEALGRNSGRIDNIMAGLEKMTGGGPKPPPPTFYDLNAPEFPGSGKQMTQQIAVAETTAPVVFQTQRALVPPNPGNAALSKTGNGATICQFSSEPRSCRRSRTPALRVPPAPRTGFRRTLSSWSTSATSRSRWIPLRRRT